MSYSAHWILLLAVALLATSVQSKIANPAVVVNLNTSWIQPPSLSVEAIESLKLTVSDISKFHLLDYLVDNDYIGKQDREFSRQRYSDLVEDGMKKYLDENNLDTTIYDLFKWSLSLRISSPRIETFHQVYKLALEELENKDEIEVSHKIKIKECESWSLIIGKYLLCDSDAVFDISEQEITDYKSNTGNHYSNFSIYTSNILPKEEFSSPLCSNSNIDLNSSYLISYVDFESIHFNQFYRNIKLISEKYCLPIILRYSFSEKSHKEIYVPGYGIELALKKTEYSVRDDRVLKDEHLNEEDNINSDKDDIFQKYSKEFDNNDLEFIKLEDKDILNSGFKITKFIINKSSINRKDDTLDSYKALNLLKVFSQDYPKWANFIKNLNIKDSEIKEIDIGSHYFRGSASSIYLNSIKLTSEHFKNVFYVQQLISSEINVIKNLQSYGLDLNRAKELFSTITAIFQGTLKLEDKQEEIEFPFTELYQVDSPSILWINNIEKDLMYNSLPKSLSVALRNGPYQIQPIRRNILNIVVIVDFSNVEQLKAITKFFNANRTGTIIRVGYLPAVFLNNIDSKGNLNENIKLALLFYDIYKDGDKNKFIEFLYKTIVLANENDYDINAIFNNYKSIKHHSKGFDATINELYDKYKLELDELNELTNKFGPSATDNAAKGYINGSPIDLNGNWMREVSAFYSNVGMYLAKSIMSKVLLESVDIYNHFVTHKSALSSRNPYINVGYEDLVLIDWSNAKYLNILNDLKWYTSDIEENASQSIIFLSNFNNISKYNLEIIQSLKEISIENKNIRISFINTGSSDTKESFNNKQYYTSHDIVAEEYKSYSTSRYLPVFENLVQSSKLNNVLIFNSRIVTLTSSLSKNNIKSIIDEETTKRYNIIFKSISLSNDLKNLVDKDNFDLKFVSYILSKAFDFSFRSDVSVRPYRELIEANRYNELFNLPNNNNIIRFGNKDTSIVNLDIFIDPLSTATQEIIDTVIVLSKIEGISLNIYLVPKRLVQMENIEATPIKRFYRSSIPYEPKFEGNSSKDKLVEPRIVFKDMPQASLLTLGIDVPSSWLVLPVESIYDLDNIVLKSVEDSQLSAKFELKNILIEGYTTQSNMKVVPQGLEWLLYTPSKNEQTGTITMNNLGYIQFKSSPGIHKLHIRPGRSLDIYKIDEIKGSFYATNKLVDIASTLDFGKYFVKEEENEESAYLFLDSFNGLTLFPSVEKRQGMENENVLVLDKESEKGYFGNFFKNDEVSYSTKNKIINVFSVASGHLYERFLGIMMRSVTQKTDSKVKFWLIQNFLSPSFLVFLPYLAKELNCEYELITYKWPHWLNKQTEKQRIIWAYKILFLDVMFPLDLDKVIFVDADQVVRTDLQELIDMNLNGAVYGYTPFCEQNNRPETDKFRFWSTGYWKQQLRGRPYHISALYVIDLKRFRQFAAGDKLRQSYHALSQDPNSLANLDQDLPNVLIHEIPMFSLPQEWLWCETWCNDESLKSAKTIDLCNNPLTKEPKLDRARRILPEWDVLDKEVENIRQNYLKTFTANDHTNDNTNKHDEL